MQTLVVSPAARLPSLQAYGWPQQLQVQYTAIEELASYPGAPELIVDVSLDEAPQRLQLYARFKGAWVLGCAVRLSAAHIYANFGSPANQLLGINALPGFWEHGPWELSVPAQVGLAAAQALVAKLGLPVHWVADRIGMVRPRILFSIINEACWLQGQGVASQPDIELAMRLGVNYPNGPFEWLAICGVQQVVSVLQALAAGYGNETYRVAPLLWNMYWQSGSTSSLDKLHIL